MSSSHCGSRDNAILIPALSERSKSGPPGPSGPHATRGSARTNATSRGVEAVPITLYRFAQKSSC